MAYNGFYPQFYPQNPQPQMQQPTQQISNSGLVPVPSEQFARNYPVAYGQSVSFRDENAPYLYTKTMGFSQLDTPRFEKYRLVKEEAETPVKEPQVNQTVNVSSDELKAEIEALKGEIEGLKKELSDLKEGV